MSEKTLDKFRLVDNIICYIVININQSKENFYDMLLPKIKCKC